MTSKYSAAVAVAVAAFLGAVVAASWAAGRPDRYSASTTVAVAPANELVDDADVIDVVGGLDRGSMVETLAGLAASPSLVAAASGELGIPSEDVGDYEIDAVRVTAASLVDVSVTGPDPDRVAALSTTVAGLAAQRFNSLYPVYRVEVVIDAEVPESSGRPSVLLIAVAGGAVGALCVALVLVAGRARRREHHLASVRGGREEWMAS
jgi:capsular polysaccharide biosynthesis protein